MSDLPQSESPQFLIYQSEDGTTRVDVRLQEQTLWLSQKQLTELFGKAKGTISDHIKHIFEDAELEPAATVRLFRTVQSEGGREVSREVEHYNLDMVLALGFRVRSPVAVRFRQWAADKLKEYITKGFVLDDQRLKNPGKGVDYFDELTRRLQDIRTSERRFYQKITDIYATSVDYDPTAHVTQTFFATVQNKVHFAIHGQTAAELIAARADSSQPNMGLTNWDGARIRKTDVSIAKNYLSEDELLALNNLAEQYLVFAEGQAMRRVAMTMVDWVTKLEGFLTLNDREILQGAGKVSAQLAKAHAEHEFDKFRVLDDQHFESDFDRMVKQLPQKRQMKPQ
ncbi:virulence RhuM family protein [Rhodoferax sp.]|uniref:virulence RhuM family protein n=1 Tax=Rhodoferax sp. TaxID=50421 RepID=UPI002607BFCC|nr:virulence RhuM family protein [Rhodoferax sp.]MDD5478278.1 virulence RhuM family protein [Rhodoferax sp.]